jgi:multicomponent K+:H+ antiporter subunit E
MLTAPYWPNRPAIRRPLKIAEYILIVLWDIVVANVQVALIILFKREPTSGRTGSPSRWT